jgi:hypothetical protein
MDPPVFASTIATMNKSSFLDINGAVLVLVGLVSPTSLDFPAVSVAI